MVATPQPNPRRRMPTVLPIAPPNRGAGIMTLPTSRPTAVQRAMATRRPIREPRSLAETFAEGRDVLEGLGTGAVAGLGGLPADLTGIIFGDIPAVINKLVTGETINQEESPYFQQLNEFRRTYGAEGIMRLMGAGDRLDAPSDSDDALSRAGINPFRQGAFVGEFLLDPFALAKAPKAIKRAMSPLSEQEERNLIAYERSLRGLDPNPIRADQTARTAAVTEAEQAAQLARFEELTEQAPIEEGFEVAEDGQETVFYTVRMRDGRVVEDASEERLRELYATDIMQQEEDARQTARLAGLDALAEDAGARRLATYQGVTGGDRVDSVDGQFTYAPGLRQREIDDQFGPNVFTANPGIIPGGLAGGDGVTIFNYVPGLTDDGLVRRLTLGQADQEPGFSFFEFQEDMYDITGRRIPAGARIAFPDSISDEFQNLFYNSPPQTLDSSTVFQAQRMGPQDVEARTPDQLRAISLRGTEAEEIADDFDDYVNAAMGTDREPGVDYVMQSIMESPDTRSVQLCARSRSIRSRRDYRGRRRCSDASDNSRRWITRNSPCG